MLHEMPIEKITVAGICRIAEINRGTFYIHYQNPYDLLKKMEEEYAAKMVEDIRQLIQLMMAKKDYRPLGMSMHHINVTDDIHRFLLTHNPSSSNIMQQMRREVEPFVKANMMEYYGFSEEKAQIAFELLYAGSQAVDIYLLKKNASPGEVDRMIAIMDDIIENGLGK
ncbi:MAG: hypothetical protein PHO10_01950 [Gemmiger sp.]|nr:hypothetical protein [Gemmiger sp.]